MSKESSIKVYAENFSGSDKPVNAIPVWIENASAISGGGGGGGSIPSDVSGKWEDASDCVQTNSGTWGQGGGSIPTDFSANNITANDSVVVGQFEQDEWGINISGIQFNTDSININPRYTQSEVGYIALTSRKPNQYWQETTATANINAFDWNKLMEVYNIVSTNSGNW